MNSRWSWVVVPGVVAHQKTSRVVFTVGDGKVKRPDLGKIFAFLKKKAGGE